MAVADAPLVAVSDEDGIWEVVERVINNHLPLRRLHPPASLEAIFKVRDRQKLAMENVPLQFKMSPGFISRPSDHDKHRRHTDPYFHLYVLNCESKRRSLKDLRTLAMKWAESLRAQEFLIVLVTPSLHRATVLDKKLVDHAENLFSKVEEKLKSRYKQRVVRLSSEQEVMHRIGECLVASFDRLLQAYEIDTVRSLEAKAAQPINWNFCSQYFPIREGFAAMLLQFNLTSLALLVYLNMETMLGKLQGNVVSFTGVTTPQQLQQYTQPDRAPLMFQLSPEAASEYRSAIRMSQVTELAMRIFLAAAIMRLSFAAQEHLTFLGRFGSRLALWVELISSVPGIRPPDVALFEAAAHISVVRELESIVNSVNGCAIPFSPSDRSVAGEEPTSGPLSGEFPHMTQLSGMSRQDSMDSIGDAVANDSVLMQESSEGSDPYTPRKHSTGLTSPVSVPSGGATLQNSPWASASVASMPQTPSHRSTRGDPLPEAPLQLQQQCYAAMASSLCLAQSRTVAAAKLLGLSLAALKQPPTHISLSSAGGTAASQPLEPAATESASQRSFVRQYIDLTRAARDYSRKANRSGMAQQMSYELALLHAYQGQHEEVFRCLTSVLQHQHRCPWPSLQYCGRLYLRNCCSHLLRAPADSEFAQHVWVPYLRSALWLAGHNSQATSHSLSLVPSAPLHPHRDNEPIVPPAFGAPSHPSQMGAWRIAKEGLAACPSQPFTGTLSAVVDIVSIRRKTAGLVRPFEPFAAEVTLRSRIPEEMRISNAALTLRTSSAPSANAPAPVSTSKAVPVHLHLKRPTHGSSHSFDLSFADGLRQRHTSAQFRSVSCNPTPHAPRSPDSLRWEPTAAEDEATPSEDASWDSAGATITMTRTDSKPIALLPGVDTVVEVSGQLEQEGWYRAASLLVDCQDLPLSLLEGPPHRDEFAHCDSCSPQPPRSSHRLTGVQLPANYSPDHTPCTLPVFGRTPLKNFQLCCAEEPVERLRLFAAVPEDGCDALPGGAGCLPLFTTFLSWSAEKGPREHWSLVLRAQPLPADAPTGQCTLFTHLKMPNVLPLYRAEEVEQSTHSFGGSMLGDIPRAVGTVCAVVEGEQVRLTDFTLREELENPCPRLCIALQVPLDASWQGRTAVVRAEFAFRADGPSSTDRLEVEVPDAPPASGLVGSSHAVSLGTDVWVTCHIRHAGRLPVRFVAHHLTPPAHFAVHTTKLPQDLCSHTFSCGEEMNCVFGIAPSNKPPDYTVPGWLLLRYVAVRGPGSTVSPEATLVVPIEIRHRLPPVLSPGYKVCVTLTSNAGDFQTGMMYPLDIYVFSRAETNQVNAVHHLVDVEIDVTVSKGRTPWMTSGTLAQRLTLQDGKGQVQIHLVAMRGGQLPLPTVRLFSVPVCGLKRGALPADLEYPFHEVQVTDATPVP